MTRALQSLAEVAAAYDAIVLDQWGVLHNGSVPYPGAVATLERLRSNGARLAVLSNSGKRAAANAERITAMGYPADLFTEVMTSGEALWRDVASGQVRERRFYPIEGAAGDAAAWARGLDITLTDDPAAAEAILLMGLPDDAVPTSWDPVLAHALAHAIPVYCSNPDRKSPRATGTLVLSPGALAHAHRDRGGQVIFYGKPHRAIFTALESALGAARLLMVGDSLEHDIAGAAAAGWDSAFVQGGIHAAEFAGTDPTRVLAALSAAAGAPAPTYTLGGLT